MVGYFYFYFYFLFYFFRPRSSTLHLRPVRHTCNRSAIYVLARHHNRDLRCVSSWHPGTLRSSAGCKTRLVPRIKTANPISFMISFQAGKFAWYATFMTQCFDFSSQMFTIEGDLLPPRMSFGTTIGKKVRMVKNLTGITGRCSGRAVRTTLSC